MHYFVRISYDRGAAYPVPDSRLVVQDFPLGGLKRPHGSDDIGYVVVVVVLGENIVSLNEQYLQADVCIVFVRIYVG